MTDREEALKLDNQLCFATYSAARAIIRAYKPLLKMLGGITYTQYITLLVLWEEDNITVKHLGERLILDSGTLTPLLKKMEKEDIIKRIRDKNDERKIYIKLTKKGHDLKRIALEVPDRMFCKLPVTMDELTKLREILKRVYLKTEMD